MTLFYVLDEKAPAGVSPLKLPAAELLFLAIDQFRAQPAK